METSKDADANEPNEPNEPKEVTRATVRLSEGMRFVAQGDTSGQTSIMDAAVTGGGQNSGPRPMELLLFGLGGCTGMDVASILRKKRQPFTGLEMNLSGDRAPENPKRFTAIHNEYVVHGKGVDPKAVADAIRLSEERYCSARACFNCPVTSSFRIIED
jgi:putative redox protein